MISEDALKSRLQAATKATGLTFNEVFHQLIMERFLVRLSLSNHASHFIFKGGFLLSRYVDLGRDTRDLDFLLSKLTSQKEILEPVLTEIAQINASDNFVYSLKKVKILVHDHMNYPGYTANLAVNFGKMRENLDIDIGVGDTVSPARTAIKLMQSKGKSIFEDEVSLLVYPPETILAEKLQTAVLRAGQNSRMKDFYDILCILESSQLSKETFKKEITTTFNNRKTSIEKLPLRFSDAEFETLQKFWGAFYRSLRKKDHIPQSLREVVEIINLQLIQLGF